jgi:integrase
VWRLRAYVGEKPNPNQPGKTMPVQLSETFHGSERAADKALGLLVAKADQLRPSETETFGALLDRWIVQCEGRKCSPNTLKNYRQMSARLTEKIGTVKLDNPTAEHLDRIYAEMAANGKSSATIHKYHAFISGALQQAFKWDLVTVNVARKASPPKRVSPVVQVLTAEDVRTLVATADSLHDSRHTYRNAHTVMATLLYVAAHTGMRRGELGALLWSDIDFENATITVSKALFVAKAAHGGQGVKAPKSARGNRIVDIGAGCVARLRRHHDWTVQEAETAGVPVPADGYVFSQDFGYGPLDLYTVSKFTKRVGDKCGVPVHTHSLRHFATSNAIAAGYDVATVAERMGDSVQTIQDVYAHAMPARQKALAAAMDLDDGAPALN